MQQTSDLGEIGAKFSLQLSSRTQFAKINNKKVIAENRVFLLAKKSDFVACEQQGADKSDKRSLISAFVVRLLESTIDLLQAKFKYSS